MQPPPRDTNGKVTAHDHAGILPADVIIRKISEFQTPINAGTGRRQISSSAFKASTGVGESMSVEIEKLILEDGLDPRVVLITPRWIGSVFFTAEDLRSEQLLVGWDPTLETASEPANPYHGGVWGDYSKPLQRKLKRKARWYVQIPDVDMA